MSILDSIIEPGEAQYYFLANADGKKWILPRRHLSTALELYQPGGIKVRLLKRFMPVVHPFAPARRVMHAGSDRIALAREILDQAASAFGTDGLEYSIFGGTPSVHQKITIQFFRGNRILGYAKVTDSDDIASLFDNEQRLLSTLHDAGIDDIPRCLFNGPLPSGQRLFIQTTKKTADSFSPYRWNRLHDRFLHDLHSRTVATHRFEDTDFARSLTELHNHASYIPEPYRAVIVRELDSTLTSLRGTTGEYSAFHADFTPWNMFVQDGRLFVFDWEYGRMSYPAGLDRHHFHVQKAIHVGHLSPARALDQLKAIDGYSDTHLRYYLLDIISRFTLREKGAVSAGLDTLLRYWTEMLNGIAPTPDKSQPDS